MVKRKSSQDPGKAVPKRAKPKDQPRLRCPFQVHREQDRSSEGDTEFNNCNQDQTFAGTEKLNEHLDRVHSPKWWCLRCKHKFLVCGGRNLDALKKDHGGCEEKPWSENQKEWVKHNLMSEEQYLRSKTWKEENIPRPPRCEGKPKERKAMWSWRKIYKRLFPDTIEFPNPCHVDPLDSSQDPTSQDATSQDATSQDANSVETDEGDTTSAKTGNSSSPDSMENGPVLHQNGSAIPQNEPVIHPNEPAIHQSHLVTHQTDPFAHLNGMGIRHHDPDPGNYDLLDLNELEELFQDEQDNESKRAEFYDPYSGDLTWEEYRQRDEGQAQEPWLETIKGPASMAFSHSSGGTGIPRPRTPSFLGDNHPEFVVARGSLDFGREGVARFDPSLVAFLKEGGLKHYGPLEDGRVLADEDVPTQRG